MHTEPLRALVDKWLGPGAAMTARVMEFSRTPSDRRRYVHAHNFHPPNYASITGIGMRVTAVTLRGRVRKSRNSVGRCLGTVSR
jgi:hypothetical protein